MKFIKKRQHPKPVADSNSWAVSCRKAKRPKFKDMDLKRIAEFDDIFGLSHYNLGRGVSYGSASLVTRPGFSKEEPRRAASAGLEGSVKFYHSSGELLFLGGMRGATIVYLNDVMSYFKYIIG